MKEKIEKLEKFMEAEGLTLEDVHAYCVNELEKERLSQEQKAKEEERKKIAEIFPEDDVRSRALLYDYAFEGGKFSPEPNAYPNCQGVVGWINPDPDAPEGERVYIVLLEQKIMPYSSELCYVGADDSYDGRANTLKLIEYGKKHGIKFPAAEFAFNYCKNGVKKGEAFLPATKQLVSVRANFDEVRQAFNKIGGVFNGELWSSTESSKGAAVCVTMNNNDVVSEDKRDSGEFNCFLAY